MSIDPGNRPQDVAPCPKYPPPELQALPQEMTDCPQWVVWTPVFRNGKWTKVPKQPRNPAFGAKSNDPSTWATFGEAVAAYENAPPELNIVGIGFEFSKDDPFCGIDLDDCRDPGTGAISAWAQEIIDDVQSYSEVSPSLTGIKIICKAVLPEGGNRKPVWIDGVKVGDIEMYDQGRFFTVTGMVQW